VQRTRFFAGIAERLRAGGLLASSDLAADVISPQYEVLLRAWLRMMAAAEVSPEAIERIRIAYTRDVAVLPPGDVASIIGAGGFDNPTLFFQGGLIHAWLSRRAGAVDRS
jgi:tRNA (cmo5U34)-methyltransferase